MLSRTFADEGYRVVAVDADPDANLGLALGFPTEISESITPISEMKKLVSERTGAEAQSFGKMFKMNPKVDDIPDLYCKEYNNVRLLTLGTVDSGGSGCVCPEHVLLKRLCSHLILQNKDVVIMDMERSLQTYRKVKKLGNDIGVKKVFVVGNKIRNKSDEDFVTSNLQDGELLGFIYYNQDVIDSDRASKSPYDVSLDTKDQIVKIKNRLMTNS